MQSCRHPASRTARTFPSPAGGKRCPTCLCCVRLVLLKYFTARLGGADEGGASKCAIARPTATLTRRANARRPLPPAGGASTGAAAISCTRLFFHDSHLSRLESTNCDIADARTDQPQRRQAD